MSYNRRRRTVFLSALVAVVLAMASVASACTVFKGRMTITDNTNSSNTSTGIGSNLGMSFCSGGTPNRVEVDDSTGFTVSVAPQSSLLTATCNASLGTNTYNVNYFATSNTSPGDSATDCMNGTGNGTNLTTISTTNGNGKVNVTGLTTIGDYKICVAGPNSTNNAGMMGFVHVY